MALTDIEEKELREQMAANKAAMAKRRADDAGDDADEIVREKPVRKEKVITGVSEATAHALLEETRAHRSELAETKPLLAGLLGKSAKAGSSAAGAAKADEPSFLGRLFGAKSPAPAAPAPKPAGAPPVTTPDAPVEEESFLGRFFK